MEFSDLVDRLTKETETQPALLQAMVELTYGCNLRCVHCYNPTHQAKNELSRDEIFEVLSQLAAQGCLVVGLTGGELFTRRDAIEIIARARSLGMMVTLVTNATLITPALADRIRDLAPYRVDVSLYGATDETYRQVTQIPGAFAAFTRGIDLLREREIPVLLKLVMMTLNIHELDAMKLFAEARGLSYRVGTDIHPRVNGDRTPLAYRLSAEQSVSVWRQSIGGDSPSETLGEGCGAAGRLFDCFCGKSSAAITPQGKMNLCVSMDTPRYDTRAGNISEGWDQLVHLVQAAAPGAQYECGNCDVNRLCTRGSNDGWLETGAFDAGCIPHFREVADKKAEWIAKK